jgi:hypothetical protein
MASAANPGKVLFPLGDDLRSIRIEVNQSFVAHRFQAFLTGLP